MQAKAKVPQLSRGTQALKWPQQTLISVISKHSTQLILGIDKSLQLCQSNHCELIFLAKGKF